MPTYRGHSTYNRAKKYKLTDFELAKQDLFNHFHIRKGEKLMNPKFGTIIWDLIFEPFTLNIKDAITADIKTIVGYDPRLVVQNVNISDFGQGIMVEIEVVYVPTNQVASLSMKFDRDAAKRAGSGSSTVL
jgi:phage baseplate assembly protein W